ncbi:hypothetical protein TNCV_2552051 [Trichonephila clavipes]|nr:hypothetical protein TNCV_2552051 [Trichonephila clavipes]
MLGRRIAARPRPPATVRDMEIALLEEWNSIPQSPIDNLIASMANSDETHFWLNGYVNKQNCRIWSEANPQVYVETTLHPEKTDCLVRFMGWWNHWSVLLQKR